MLELHQLEQLLAFSKYGTLSETANHLHISQPALSRSMQKLEKELNAALFERSKNKIELNATGLFAVDYAEKIITQTKSMIEHVHIYDQSQRTITIGVCAPAPLWKITPILSNHYPEMIISSEMKDNSSLLAGLKNNEYHFVITSIPINEPNINCVKYLEEHLQFYLPLTHPLAKEKELSMNDLNGENMLILSNIGNWFHIPQKKMPSSHFLIQEDYTSLNELLKYSSIAAFSTDLSIQYLPKLGNRVSIPISDPEACLSFYCAYRTDSNFDDIVHKFL